MSGYYNKKGEFIYGEVPAHIRRQEEAKARQKAAEDEQFKLFEEDFVKDDDPIDGDEDVGEGEVTEACLLGPPSTSANNAAGGASSSSSSSTAAPVLPPPPSDSEEEKEPVDPSKKEQLDDLFANLMGTINTMGTQRQKANMRKYSSPEELVSRILDHARSPFEILGVTPEAEKAEITKTYRNISRIIHPDKCRVERAQEAFQKVLDAYNELKEGKSRERYKDIWDEVRAEVLREHEAFNEEKLRNNDTEGLLPTEGYEFDEAVIKRCEDRLDTSQKKEEAEETYADKVRKANEERIKTRVDEEKAREGKQNKNENRWKKGMDKRVAGWQVFQANVNAKRFKSESWAKVGQVGAADRFHKREEKTDAQIREEQKLHMTADGGKGKGGLQKKAAGLDDGFKKVWR
ncbi:unnamed protein product [Amoebophrya sp. A120]|nr:unnamed protein product [Amoebophrya sp. A120]|eukprot:GSA120T00011739001.1